MVGYTYFQALMRLHHPSPSTDLNMMVGDTKDIGIGVSENLWKSMTRLTIDLLISAFVKHSDLAHDFT